MTEFTLIPGRPYHCGQMARILRDEHRSLVASLGIDSHRELRARFDASSFRKAWLIDRKLAALGGVTGSPLSSTGTVWLAFSEAALRFPLAIVKEARRQIDDLMRTHHDLCTTIIEGDDKAMRLAIFLGFVPADMLRLAKPESRHGRRMVDDLMRTESEARIELGHGRASVMAYVREAA